MMAPKTSNNRWLQVIIAGVFLSCMMIPIYDWQHLSLPSLSDNSSVITESHLSAQIEEQVINQTNAAIETLCRRYLKNYDITLQKVSVITDSSSDKGIYISCIELYLDKPNAADHFTVKQLMEQQLGIPIKVVALEEKETKLQEVDP